MPAERRYGMDHEHYAWSPIATRKVLRWPGDARVALCVIVNLEHYDWYPPEGSYQPPGIAGVRSYRPPPDYQPTTWREYGRRVGVFRIMEALDRLGIKAMVAMDALTAERYPILVEECRSRDWEFIGHGVAATRMITSRMSEGEEREYIQRSLEPLRKASGAEVVGWLSPEYGESPRTPQLLAEQGIRYICDWVNDEQPYPLNAPGRELYALPVMLEMDDIWAMWTRRIPVQTYREMLKRGFDVLYEDGATTGRLLVLRLHPWFIGQPHRIKYLRNGLDYIMGHPQVWAARGVEVIDWYRGQ